jgi:ferredoxin
MAKIMFNGNEMEVEDNTSIKKPCQDLGVPMGCQNGICGTCIVKVKKGMENLSQRTDSELEMELEDDERLACQCKILKGEVEITDEM